jgi:hypothetical protein
MSGSGTVQDGVAQNVTTQTEAGAGQPTWLEHPHRSQTLITRISSYVVGLLIVLFVIRAMGPIKDPDIFWHIRAGGLLLSDWQFVRDTDPYSVSAEQPWIFNQWIPQLALYAADRIAGLPGVAWLFGLMIAALVTVVWWVARRWADPLVAALVTALAYATMSASVAPRPQVVSFALTVVVSHVWLRTLADGRPRWWLVAVTWVWAMCHGLWVVGPLVGMAFVVGMALVRRYPWRRLALLASVPVASVLAAGLTPVGPALLTSPFQVHGVTSFISEWQPVETTEPVFIALLVLAGPVFVRIVGGPVKEVVPLAVVTLLALGLAFTYARMIAVGAAILTPLVAQSLQVLVKRPATPVHRREWGSVAVGSVVALGLSAVLVPSIAASDALGPHGSEATLDTLPSGTVLCNEWEWGGWLIYTHPDLRITMDPRAELYSRAHVESYGRFIQGQPGWQDFVEQTGCTYALVKPDRPTGELLQSKGWDVVSRADDSVVLRRPVPATS